MAQVGIALYGHTYIPWLVIADSNCNHASERILIT
jgi:hypothetical protein